MSPKEVMKGVLINSEKTFALSLGLFSFLLLPFPKISVIGLICLISSIIYLRIQRKIIWKNYTTHYLFIALYIAYVIGIAFALELSESLKYAEYKLVFLLIPLCFSFQPKFNLSIQPAIIGLIFGVICTSFLGYFSSYSCSNNGESTLTCWTSTHFSYIHHPSYFASFILIAIGAAWLGFKRNWNYFSFRNVLVFTLFGLLNYILCFSLAGLLFLFLAIGVIVFYLIAKKYNYLIASFLGILVIFFAAFILTKAPQFKVEFQEIKTSNNKFFANPEAFLKSKAKGAYVMGNEVRLIMWTLSAQIIMEHPFGVGTGNGDYYIEQKLKKYRINHLIEFRYNPHNQYLQTALEIGVFGLVLLLGIIISALIVAYRSKSFLLLLIIASLSFHSLFESMFQRQSGVLFYTFWLCLIVVYSLNKSSLKPHSHGK